MDGFIVMKQEDVLFFVGLFTLAICLFCFPFALYLLPMAWFGWEYYVPGFVVDIALWNQVYFNITYELAFLWFARCILFIAIISGAIAYWISHKLSLLEHEESEQKSGFYISRKIKTSSRDAVVFIVKMVGIISLVFLVANMIQWAISSAPPAS